MTLYLEYVRHVTMKNDKLVILPILLYYFTAYFIVGIAIDDKYTILSNEYLNKSIVFVTVLVHKRSPEYIECHKLLYP